MLQIKAVIILACYMLLPASVYALSTDRHQPIKIKADSVYLNEKTGISIYKGNVIFVQGSLILKGNRVEVYQPKGTVSKIIVTGNPARFQQQQDNVKELVHAEAGKMEFITKDERVYLSQNAFVSQGENLLKGNKIEYNTRTSTISAKGKDKGNRVTTVIEPDSQKTPNNQ